MPGTWQKVFFNMGNSHQTDGDSAAKWARFHYIPASRFCTAPNLDKIIRQQLKDFFGPGLVLESIIHRYVGVAEATAMRKGVVERSTTSPATFDFMKLFNELKREMGHEQERQGAVESIHR